MRRRWQHRKRGMHICEGADADAGLMVLALQAMMLGALSAKFRWRKKIEAP